jgi:hypothetical protein
MDINKKNYQPQFLKGEEVSVDIIEMGKELAQSGLPSTSINFNQSFPIIEDSGQDQESYLTELNTCWLLQSYHIAGLVGEKKRCQSLAIKWREELFYNPSELPWPDGIFQFRFDKQNCDPSECFRKAIDCFSGSNPEAKKIPESEYSRYLAAMLMNRRYLLVLYGLEVMRDEDGTLVDPLREFLKYVASAGDNDSLCLITSEISIKDLVPYYTYVKIDVKPSRLEKLREIGVKGSSTEELFQLIEKWGHDDLTLRLLGGYLVHCQKLGIEQPYPEPSQELSLDDPSVGIEEILVFFDRDLIVTDKLKSLLKTATTFCEDIPNSLVEEAPEFVDWGFFQYSTGLKAYTMPKPIRTYYIRKRNQAAIKILNSWFENKK